MPDPGELTGPAMVLTGRAAAAVRDSPPTPEILWLAEQLADVGRLLGQAVRAGSIIAAAYERGRLDERACRGARTQPA